MSSVAYTAATHWKTYIAGFLDWTATIECLLDDAGLDPDLDTDFAQDTNGITVVLFEGMIALDQQSGNLVRMYTGEGIITSISVGTTKDDNATVTYSVQGSGNSGLAVGNSTAT